MRKFTKEHEWIDIDDSGVATVGITAHSEQQLGDVVFVDLPSVGDEIAMDTEACVVESVKAASEIFAPVDCVVTHINDDILADTKLINRDPEGDGWFFKATLKNPKQLDDLMDSDQYADFIAI